MFSSKPPFNDDPNPYVWAEHSPRNKARVDTEMYRVGVTAEMAKYMDYEHSPRPEYNRPQHNPTNPILTEFRELHAKTGNDLWTDAYLSCSDLIEQDWGTRDEYWHAFSVLGKIVATGKVSR